MKLGNNVERPDLQLQFVEILEEVISLRHRQEFAAAEKLLEKLFSDHPEQPEVIFQLGEVCREKRLYEQAIAHYQRTLALQPSHAWAALQMGIAQRELGKWEIAEQQFHKILVLEPNHFFALMQLGHLEQQRGNRQQAIRWFQVANERAPDTAYAIHARLLLAEELRELDQLDDAQFQVQLVLEQQPQHQRASLILGSILYRRLDLVGAAKIYHRILKQDPDCLDAHLEQVRILSETHRIKEAIAQLKTLYNSGRRDFRIPLKLGQLFQAEENWLGTESWYQTAIQLFPKQPQAYAALAETIFQQGGVEPAIILLTEIEQRLPDSIEIPLKLAHLKLRLGCGRGYRF